MSNKTSDKNVVNIEEDVKILNNFCEFEDAVVLTDYALTLVQEAIINILAEREQDKKRIQELEEENKHLSNVSDYETISLECVHLEEQLEIANSRIQELEIKLKCTKDLYDDCCKCLLNSIPKQVVIDKIKEYDKKMEEDAGHPNWVVTDRIVMNVLQELLEREK